MSGVFDFQKRFGISATVEECRKRFKAFVQYKLFEPLYENYGGQWYGKVNPFYEHIYLGLGKNPVEEMAHYLRHAHVTNRWFPKMEEISGPDFESHLLIIELIYGFFAKPKEYQGPSWMKLIDLVVAEAIQTPISLEIAWKDGAFSPALAPDLENPLIAQVSHWLDPIPKAKELWANALQSHAESTSNPIRRKDAITNAQQALDVVVQHFTGNSANLEKQFGEVVEKLGLSKEWASILNRYEVIRKEYGSHPGHKEFIPNADETEAFLYLTGIFLRLISRRVAGKA